MACRILSIWLAVNRPSIVEWWRTLLSSLVVRLGGNQLLEKILRFVGNNGQFSYPGEKSFMVRAGGKSDSSHLNKWYID